MNSAIRLGSIVKIYKRGNQKIEVLHGLSLEIGNGEFVSIMGPSGSGKTTLLNLIAGLDTPTSGELVVADKRIDQLSRAERSAWRARNIGFVFQFYHLLPVLTAGRNVEVPLLLTRLTAAQRVSSRHKRRQKCTDPTAARRSGCAPASMTIACSCCCPIRLPASRDRDTPRSNTCTWKRRPTSSLSIG